MYKYILLFLGGLALTLVLTPLVRWLAVRQGVLDQPGGRKVHDHPIPRLGGLAIFLAFSVLVGLAFSPWAVVADPFLKVGRHWWTRFLLSATVIVALGALDDLRPLGVRVRVLTQVLAALVAVRFGYTIDAIGPFWGIHWELGLWSIPVTVLWIVGLTNAFNLIDGLDGLATGVALIAVLTLGGIGLVHGTVELALICALLAGCLVGFLKYNFHPASIFLGDSGSLLLGFTLAVLGITTTHKATTAASVLIPMLAFGLPIADTLLSMLRRFFRAWHIVEPAGTGRYRMLFLRGAAMFEGDRDHVHHRLLGLGINHRRAVVTLYGIAAALGALALALDLSRNMNTGLLLVGIGFAVAVAIQKLRYHELQWLRNGMLLPLIRLRILASGSFQILTDTVLIAFSYYLAYCLQSGGRFAGPAKACFITTLPIVLVTKLIVFHLTGLYRLKWQHASLPDLLRAGRSLVLGCLAAGTVSVSARLLNCPWSVLIIDFYVLTGFLLGLRLARRALDYHARPLLTGQKRVLIYGTDRAAALLVREIEHNPEYALSPIGFIDDNPSSRGKLLRGYPVLGTTAALADILRTSRPSELIITDRSLPAVRLEDIIATCRRQGVAVRQFRMSLTELSGNGDPPRTQVPEPIAEPTSLWGPFD